MLRDEAHTNASVAGRIHLARKPSLVAVARADDPEATRPANGRGKAPIGHDVHRGKHDRVGDAE